MEQLLLALVVSCVATGALVPVLRRTGFVDVPNTRSSHATPTPRGGGVAVLLALAVAWTAGVRDASAWPLVAATLGLGVVGLVDDRRSLSSRARLLAQLLGALVVVVWAVEEGVAAHPVAVFAVVAATGFTAYVNAFNFMDGINGIAALHGLLAGGWFWWVSSSFELPLLAALAASLGGAALGFLPWNVLGRVFLGDVGSYGVGALVAGMAVYAWARGVPGALAIAPLLVYLADTGWAIGKRAARREPLAQAHRGHVYQRLVDAGWSHLSVSTWAVLASSVVCTGLTWAHSGSHVTGVAVSAVALAAYLASPVALASRTPGRVPS